IGCDLGDDDTLRLRADVVLLADLVGELRELQAQRRDLGIAGRLGGGGRGLRRVLLFRELLDFDFEGPRLPLPPDLDRNHRTDPRLGNDAWKAPHLLDRFPVKAEDDVAGFDSGLLRWTVRRDAGD